MSFQKTLKTDSSIAAVSKLGSLAEIHLFDKVRQAVQHQDVYDNFLRCIALFNSNTIKRTELCVLLKTFLGLVYLSFLAESLLMTNANVCFVVITLNVAGVNRNCCDHSSSCLVLEAQLVVIT